MLIIGVSHCVIIRKLIGAMNFNKGYEAALGKLIV